MWQSVIFLTITQKMVVLEASSSQPKKNRRKLAKRSNKSSIVVSMSRDEARGNVQDVLPEDDEMLIRTDADTLHPTSAPSFPPILGNASGRLPLKSEMRRIAMPPHRMTPLKKDWVNIFGPLTEILGLQVRMNVTRKCVELRVSLSDSMPSMLKKA